jgi:hypothetical protein
MVGKAEKESMIGRIDPWRKIFIAGAVITALILCACSIFISLSDSERSALASPAAKNINVKVKSGNFQIGQKYSVSWDSLCRGGQAMVWLSTASSSQSEIGILVPLANFSAADFGSDSKDDRIFFDDPWKFITSNNANKGKLTWTVPDFLCLSKSFFGSDKGSFYIYTLADGRIVLHRIVQQPVQMPVFPDNYYLRVDIKGKNGCEATGYSSAISIVN